jgi:hypothetical protein
VSAAAPRMPTVVRPVPTMANRSVERDGARHDEQIPRRRRPPATRSHRPPPRDERQPWYRGIRRRHLARAC